MFFSGTTGGSPKWDQVIWRRTVDANGTVIEDIGVNSSDRRATLFRRLPRRTNIKTVFWYCDDAEIALSWRSKYFQQGPDREPLRVKIPDLPDVFVVSIESDNTGRVFSRCREAGYSHPNAIKFPSRKRIAREVQSALISWAELKPSEKIRDEFDFDEGRFDDHDEDDDDDQPDEGGGSSSKSDRIIQSKTVQGGGDACVSDYWERHDEDSAWYRVHVEARKKFFGTTNEDLLPGGPSHEELDTVRVTHMRGLFAPDSMRTPPSGGSPGAAGGLRQGWVGWAKYSCRYPGRNIPRVCRFLFHTTLSMHALVKMSAP